MKNQIDFNMIESLVGLCSISTDHGACLEVLNVIRDKVVGQNIPCIVSECDKQPYLMAGFKDLARTLLLSHADIVPAEESNFQLKVHNDILVGRGVLDMKGPLVVALEIFIELWQKGQRDILFVVTTDEEIGGFMGTQKLIGNFSQIKMAIVLDANTDGIVLRQNAPFHIEISHIGKSAHGSRPSEGINSAKHIAECCLGISKKLDCASITKICSGTVINKIPDKACATMDIRIKSKQNLKGIIRIIEETTNRFGCKWNAIDKPIFFEVKPKNSLIAKFAKLSGRTFCTESGTSDARFLSESLHIPVIVTSARGGNAHGSDEWVSINSLLKLKIDIFNFIISL